jgi:uncharacterized membrane protein
MAAPDSETPQTLVGIAFPDVFRAQEFFTATTRLSVNGQLTLKDAVFVTKNDEGHTVVKETADLQTLPAAASGAFWAGIFGLILGGPVGWLAGAAIGAGAGAITAKAVDLGITDEWVEWFREAVEPGNTILALLCENVDRQALIDELSRFPNAHLVCAHRQLLARAHARRARRNHAPPATVDSLPSRARTSATDAPFGRHSRDDRGRHPPPPRRATGN